MKNVENKAIKTIDINKKTGINETFSYVFYNLTDLEFQIVGKSNCLRKKCTKIYLANLRIKKEKLQMNIL